MPRCFFFTVETENVLLKTKAPVPLYFSRILNPPGFKTTEMASLQACGFCSENGPYSEC